MDIVRMVYVYPEPVGVPFTSITFHFVGFDKGQALELVNNQYSGFIGGFSQEVFEVVNSVLVCSDSLGIIVAKPYTQGIHFIPSLELF